MGHAELATTDRYVKILPQPKDPDTARGSTRTSAGDQAT